MSVDAEPGFLQESFQFLNNKTNGKFINVSLLADEMFIMKKLQLVGKKYIGFVDMGAGIESDELATCA
jgi:hypothetical protein